VDFSDDLVIRNDVDVATGLPRNAVNLTLVSARERDRAEALATGGQTSIVSTAAVSGGTSRTRFGEMQESAL
jgi:hypothetical protein